MAENERLQAENNNLGDVAMEALKRAKTEVPKVPDAPPPPEYKLYFVGTRMEQSQDGAPAYRVPDLHWNDQLGFIHTCGRGPMPFTFAASKTDPRPHAYVPRGFGEWLRREDCKHDMHGKPVECRYEWADEA